MSRPLRSGAGTLCLLAVLLTSVTFATATAHAIGTPSFLSTFGFPVTLTSRTGKVTFKESEGGSLTCSESSTAGSITGEHSGSGTIVFHGCESTGVKCKGLMDTEAGTITVSATGQPFYYRTSPLAVAIVYTVPLTHSNCGAAILLEKRGCVESVTTPINTDATKYTVEVATETINEYFTGTGEEKQKCALEISKNHGGFVGLGEAVVSASAELGKLGEVMG